MQGKRPLREPVLGLALGALLLAGLSALVHRTSDVLDRVLAPPAELPTRVASSPKPAAMTSSILPIPDAYDDDRVMKERAESVVDYTLRASLDPEDHVVHGEGTIVFRNRSNESLSELWLHLYLNAFASEKTLFVREAKRDFRGALPLTEPGHIEVEKLVARELAGIDLWPDADRHSPGLPDDATDIRVPLPSPLPPGGTLTLDVAFRSKLPRIVARTGHDDRFHMVAQWFPKLARLEDDGTFKHFPFHPLSEFYADFGTYDVTIEVPEGYVVGATGPRVESHREGGKVRVRHVQDSVHDFAFTVWDGFQEREVDADGVLLRVLYPEGYEAIVERQIATAKFGLRRFGEVFGRYPYPVLTIVHPPPSAHEAGGMEYPTLITTGGVAYQPDGLRLIEHLTLHELGHQYFYGLIATDEHAWPFLDEGITSFVESIFLRELLGAGSLLDFGGLKLGITEAHRFAALDRRHRAPIAQPAQDFATGTDYAALVYSRTATIFSTLARVYGEDRVLRALGRYARRYRFEHPGPEELLAAFGDALGPEVERNLRHALLERGFVDYAVAGIVQERFGEAYQGHVELIRRGGLVFPVEIELRFEDGTIERARWDGAPPTFRLSFQGKSPLVAATVDPDHRVLLDENLFDNVFHTSPRPGGLFAQLSFWASLLVHGVSP